MMRFSPVYGFCSLLVIKDFFSTASVRCVLKDANLLNLDSTVLMGRQLLSASVILMQCSIFKQDKTVNKSKRGKLSHTKGRGNEIDKNPYHKINIYFCFKSTLNIL